MLLASWLGAGSPLAGGGSSITIEMWDDPTRLQREAAADFFGQGCSKSTRNERSGRSAVRPTINPKFVKNAAKTADHMIVAYCPRTTRSGRAYGERMCGVLMLKRKTIEVSVTRRLASPRDVLYIDVVCSVQRGAAKAMVNAARRFARERGVRLALLCATDLAASYWQKQGFRSVKPRELAIPGVDVEVVDGKVYDKDDECEFMLQELE